MFARIGFLGWMMVGIALVGCGDNSSSKPAAGGAAPGGTAAKAPADEKMNLEIAPPPVSDEEIAKNLASLEPADREKALAQKLCPISLHPLGSMAGCMKVNYKGQDVYLCCEGCKASFEKDPDAAMAKLAEAQKNVK